MQLFGFRHKDNLVITDFDSLKTIEGAKLVEAHPAIRWRSPGHDVITGEPTAGWWDYAWVRPEWIDRQIHYNLVQQVSLLEILVVTGTTVETIRRQVRWADESLD